MISMRLSEWSYRRKPRLLFRFVVVFLLRLAERRLLGLLFVALEARAFDTTDPRAERGAVQAPGIVAASAPPMPEDRLD